MGLIGDYTISETGMTVSNAYISTYKCRGMSGGHNAFSGYIMVEVLDETDPRRAILENRMEAPENWYEAAAACGSEAVGRYEIKGSLCVFASKQARLDNKNPIGGFDYCCCVENLDQPILSSVYAKIKSLNPQLEDDL